MPSYRGFCIARRRRHFRRSRGSQRGVRHGTQSEQTNPNLHRLEGAGVNPRRRRGRHIHARGTRRWVQSGNMSRDLESSNSRMNGRSSRLESAFNNPHGENLSSLSDTELENRQPRNEDIYEAINELDEANSIDGVINSENWDSFVSDLRFCFSAAAAIYNQELEQHMANLMVANEK